MQCESTRNYPPVLLHVVQHLNSGQLKLLETKPFVEAALMEHARIRLAMEGSCSVGHEAQITGRRQPLKFSFRAFPSRRSNGTKSRRVSFLSIAVDVLPSCTDSVGVTCFGADKTLQSPTAAGARSL